MSSPLDPDNQTILAINTCVWLLEIKINSKFRLTDNVSQREDRNRDSPTSNKERPLTGSFGAGIRANAGNGGVRPPPLNAFVAVRADTTERRKKGVNALDAIVSVFFVGVGCFLLQGKAPIALCACVCCVLEKRVCTSSVFT